MLENLPAFITITFGLTTLITLLLLHWVIKNSSDATVRKRSTYILLGLITWLAIQGVLTIKNVYNSHTNVLPPKIILFGFLPAILTIIYLFVTKKGRRFADSLPLRNLTYLNVIRIPVEIVLYWLYQNKAVPQLMTFEGRNFDIIAGITAPFIAYFGCTKEKVSSEVILIWNLVCTGLLLNIVVNALLSAPFPFQKFALDQPDVAILNFPVSWLPTFIVPVVLFGHLVSIKQLISKNLRKKNDDIQPALRG